MCAVDSKPYEVGKRFAIQCVHGRLYDHIAWWPVMGEAHRDAEIVNFPHLHYHVDWRFVSDRTYQRHVGRPSRGESINAHVVPLMLLPRLAPNTAMDDAPHEIVSKVRRLKCKRMLPAYPHGLTGWMNALAAHYAGACLKRGVCPHRGYDISREPVVDGVVTCPLHGLRWNVETGAAVPPPASLHKPFNSSAIAA